MSSEGSYFQSSPKYYKWYFLFFFFNCCLNQDLGFLFCFVLFCFFSLAFQDLVEFSLSLKNLEIAEKRKKRRNEMHHVSTFPCFLVKAVTPSTRLKLLSGTNVLRTIWLLLICVSVLVMVPQRNRTHSACVHTHYTIHTCPTHIYAYIITRITRN